MSVEAYRVKLKDFEGSIDLLLHLVKKAKLDIAAVPLAEVTDQYIEFMAQVGSVDMERASDFLETASLLLLIKSRALLPLPVQPPDEIDPEEELRLRLQLYEVFRAASEPLRTLENSGAAYFYRQLEEPLNKAVNEPPEVDAESLLIAFQRIMQRRQRPDEHPHRVEAEVFSVQRQKEWILALLTDGPFTFASLFDLKSPRQEVAVTFMALLELWAAGILVLEQSRPFAAIEVSSA